MYGYKPTIKEMKHQSKVLAFTLVFRVSNSYNETEENILE
ncbi:hypothetical protein SAMN00777080_1548 [Aquiflexum balticum DSM 16537]|uniref:Uncharacterized protein n=1 Tax=Aquiflexum balticum DSM 16537 TaxID=758820 RepID=A0A1W2H1Y3_9BACT|nr:hypothetical protein SAMN00777080_1548 [Aquiflexum balticum DSM 16537]